jgi:hypothetical protein
MIGIETSTTEENNQLTESSAQQQVRMELQNNIFSKYLSRRKNK